MCGWRQASQESQWVVGTRQFAGLLLRPRGHSTESCLTSGKPEGLPSKAVVHHIYNRTVVLPGVVAGKGLMEPWAVALVIFGLCCQGPPSHAPERVGPAERSLKDEPSPLQHAQSGLGPHAGLGAGVGALLLGNSSLSPPPILP